MRPGLGCGVCEPNGMEQSLRIAVFALIVRVVREGLNKWAILQGDFLRGVPPCKSPTLEETLHTLSTVLVSSVPTLIEEIQLVG